MRQRPVACLALLVFLILTLIPAGFFYEDRPVEEKCEAVIAGRVSRCAEREGGLQLMLQDCQVRAGQTEFRQDKMIVYLNAPGEYPPGIYLSLSGTVYPTQEPTNPGQFNARLYYASQGVSYTVFSDQILGVQGDPWPAQTFLLSLKKRLGEVYETVLSERDSGLVRAMVLGDRQELDTEVKEFYQKNGISHLLAISGLHISLVGAGTYRILKKICG